MSYKLRGSSILTDRYLACNCTESAAQKLWEVGEWRIWIAWDLVEVRFGLFFQNAFELLTGVMVGHKYIIPQPLRHCVSPIPACFVPLKKSCLRQYLLQTKQNHPMGWCTAPTRSYSDPFLKGSWPAHLWPCPCLTQSPAPQPCSNESQTPHAL